MLAWFSEELPDWERLLAAERHLQSLLDGDHVLEDLRPRFDEVLAALEAAAGWQTSRVKRPGRRWPKSSSGWPWNDWGHPSGSAPGPAG
jgi:hypothetical protein